MYKLIKSNGESITTENILFIKKHSNGCLVQCSESEATGVSHRSVAYNLFGSEGIGAQETVSVITVDGGIDMQVSKESCVDFDELIAGLIERITELELNVGV